MTIIKRGRCTRCAAELRRTRSRGAALCDPCRRAGPDPRRDLPPGFYFQDSIAAALADYDFRIVFRRVRAHTGWSQQTLANLVGLDQARISAIERGVGLLYLATARLATQAGWMSFDVNQHEAARRLWMIALDVARAADHPLGTDQTVFVLYDMALQAVHLDRPDEARRLVHLGHAATAGPHPVSAATTSCLANIQARAHAAQGDAVSCDRALGQAIEQFDTIDRADHESWTDFLDETMLASYQGDAYYELAVAKRDPRAAGQAVPLLRHTVDHFGPDYARLRALDLTNLAGAHAIAGDIDTAVTLGHQAIDAVTAVSSPRAHDRLRVLNTVLEPLHTSTGVAELRDRLTVTAV